MGSSFIASYSGNHSSVIYPAQLTTDDYGSEQNLLKAVEGNTTVADRIKSSKAWQNEPNRRTIIEILEKTGKLGDEDFSRLVAAQDMDRKDARGQTYLHNIHQLATQALHESIRTQSDQNDGETTRKDLLLQMFDNLLDPDREVRQGSANTCTVASAEYALVKSRPEEYVRILAELTSKEGAAAILRNDVLGGDWLRLQTESFAHGKVNGTWGRDIASTLFQGAMMDNARDGYDASGLTNTALGPEFNDTITKLFNRPYKEYYPQHDPDSGQKIYAFLSKYKNSDPVFIFEKGHELVFDHIDAQSGDVYLRNPWGPSTSAQVEQYGHIVPEKPELVKLTRAEFETQVKDMNAVPTRDKTEQFVFPDNADVGRAGYWDANGKISVLATRGTKEVGGFLWWDGDRVGYENTSFVIEDNDYSNRHTLEVDGSKGTISLYDAHYKALATVHRSDLYDYDDQLGVAKPKDSITLQTGNIKVILKVGSRVVDGVSIQIGDSAPIEYHTKFLER